MEYDDFIGEVQHRAQLGSREDALRTSRATLTTLGERIQEGEAGNLAAQLPKELGRHVEKSEEVESFPYQEFIDRVAEYARNSIRRTTAVRSSTTPAS